MVIITINRPAKRNAIDVAISAALNEAFVAFEADPAARVAVLTGADDVFCGGADLATLVAGKLREIIEVEPGGFGGLVRLRRRKVVAAAVNGHAIAGGFELVLAADLAVAVSTAEFGLPPLPLIERILELFPNAWFADAYGLTETVSGHTFLDKGNVCTKLGSVGKPVLHTEVRVVDLEGKPTDSGVHGEVVIRGPKVCLGYWRDADATAAAFRDGRFHTGGIGYLDQDGYLFIVDRLKDVIISGGENIASLEVERVLDEHPAIREAAVVARPDDRWNEVPVAYVVAKPGLTVDKPELAEFCAGRLAKFKVPKAFRFIEELPRNPSGKILKRELREREAQTTGEAATADHA